MDLKCPKVAKKKNKMNTNNDPETQPDSNMYNPFF